MGILFCDGIGVFQDFEVVFGWFKKVYDGGYLVVGMVLGLFYFNGQGVEKSELEVMWWFCESVLCGDVWGVYNMVFMFGK